MFFSWILHVKYLLFLNWSVCSSQIIKYTYQCLFICNHVVFFGLILKEIDSSAWGFSLRIYSIWVPDLEVKRILTFFRTREVIRIYQGFPDVGFTGELRFPMLSTGAIWIPTVAYSSVCLFYRSFIIYAKVQRKQWPTAAILNPRGNLQRLFWICAVACCVSFWIHTLAYKGDSKATPQIQISNFECTQCLR